ncbi:hypothetical protein HOLleu_27208 [Holothuria leucospilota]|uniref:Uncharacterized protein n=1 Tax=Holothuria leucospilota TaxID=206669 RepID=A0A9Q1BPZ2_HOLLE|nr:hypothetical protein HOLleu_27208 [Holothuria leucospilota]
MEGTDSIQHLQVPDTAELQLSCPDLDDLRSQRQERTRSAMEALDSGLMKRTLPDICSHISLEERAAVCIQRHFRGHLGRKEYLQALFYKFEEV